MELPGILFRELFKFPFTTKTTTSLLCYLNKISNLTTYLGGFFSQQDKQFLSQVIKKLAPTILKTKRTLSGNLGKKNLLGLSNFKWNFGNQSFSTIYHFEQSIIHLQQVEDDKL